MFVPVDSCWTLCHSLMTTATTTKHCGEHSTTSCHLQFRFDFTCFQCGYHPAVEIADVNWKLAFDVPREIISGVWNSAFVK